MRSFEYTEDEEIKDLKAEPWQLDLIKMNPSYTYWGPHEDYMCEKGDGWNSPMMYDNWKTFSDWKLNDLNECVNFYFEVVRDTEECSCGDGYHPDARNVVDSFYDFKSPTGIGWKNNITDDEYQALVDDNRISFKNHQVPESERVLFTKDEVNEQNRNHVGWGHDGINQVILVEARLKRLGIEKYCPICKGEAYNYIAEKAHVQLVLWMIHPRKGASRGVEIKNIEQSDLPAIFTYLKEAASRNANRFSRIPL